MPPSDLVTGEAVALDLRPAALPSRLVAGALDSLLQAALLGGLALLAAATGTATSSAGQAALSVVVVLAVLAGYPVAFESLMRGRTPGKAVLGLRVVRDDGGPVGFRQSLVRGLASTFVERPGVTFFTGAVVCMLLNERSKRIGDLLAGTVVLQERVAASTGVPADPPPQLAAWARQLDLTGLPDELAVSCRAFLARSRELTPAARDELGGRLATAVAAVVTPAPPPDLPPWAYLSAVLAERSRRARQEHDRPAPPAVTAPPHRTAPPATDTAPPATDTAPPATDSAPLPTGSSPPPPPPPPAPVRRQDGFAPPG